MPRTGFEPATGSVSDGPLWGRSKEEIAGIGMAMSAFQTDPCGVEAAALPRGQPIIISFQTDPCGVEARSVFVRVSSMACFRRTLVGSKLMSPTASTRSSRRFQTDPCGVEVTQAVSAGPGDTGFRRTLVGSKSAPEQRPAKLDGFQTDPCGVEVSRSHDRWRPSNRFRRTLVGSKLQRCPGVGPVDKVFQTDPCGVEVRHHYSAP